MIDQGENVTALMRTIAGGVETYGELVATYFAQLADLQSASFWNGFLEEQHLLIAAGAPYLDERILKGVLFGQMISVFLDIGRPDSAFVTGTFTGGQRIELAKSDRRIAEMQSWLSIKFAFAGYSDSEVGNTLRTFVRFLSRAERHCLDGREDEGFLHFIVALDLVFGDKDEATKSVSARVACIAHRASGRTYAEESSQIRGLYDARSRYVHSGTSVKPEMIQTARTICSAVFHCLLRLNGTTGDDLKISDWKSHLV